MKKNPLAMKARDYISGDKISRKWAWEDIQDDFPRMWEAIKNVDISEVAHVYTDMHVNLWRMIGFSDRDTSQRLGRTTAVLSVLVPLVLAVA